MWNPKVTEIGINRYCVWTVRDFSFPNTIGISNRFLRVTFTKLSHLAFAILIRHELGCFAHEPHTKRAFR